MDETRKSCVEETQHDRGDFAGTDHGNWNQPGPSTLDYSRGQEFRKVCPPQEVAHNLFLQSGFAANMEDEHASCMMMDKAMPFMCDGTANFAFCFNKNLRIRTSTFEDHGQFAYTRICGKGATGEVQAYTDTESLLKFVRKRCRKTDGQKGPIRKEEVQSLVMLRHSGVVKLHALLCNGGTVDLLMEDCGYPLSECLKKFCKDKISGEKYWKVVEDLGRQGFEALMYIHGKGIGHLDVKPENFLADMVPNDRRKSLKLVLADFGSAVALSEEMTFDMPLTPYYWPRELWLHFEEHVRMLQRGGKDVYQFFPTGSLDTYAMGLCVNYMGNLKHLLKDLEDQQKTETPVIPPQTLDHACQNFPGLNLDFVFKLFLMKHYACEIPKLATRGPWLFPGIPPTLLQVIQGTLHPDPELRWTDEQAVHCLAGKRMKQQVEKIEPDVETRVDPYVPSQPGMNAPIQVQDPDMGGCSLPEQAPGQFIPVPEASQQAPDQFIPVSEASQQALDIVVSASADTAGLPGDKPKMSEVRKHFSRRFIPLLELWGQNTSPSQGASQRNEGIRTAVSMQTGVVRVEQNDMVVGSHGQKIEGPTQQPSTANKLWAETKTKAGVLKQNGIEHELAEGSTREKIMKGLEEKTDGKIMNVTENLEMLSMQNTVALAQQTPKTEGGKGKGAVYGKGGGKGAVYGKGGGKRKPVRPGGKREESKEIFDKVKAGSAITKIRSPGKTVSLHTKKVPLLSGQDVPPQVHFLVASSSHPKPKTHTLAVTGTAPPQDVVAKVDVKSGKLDRPPDVVSVGPSYGLEQYSSVQPGGYGSSFQREDRLVADGGLLITDGASIASYAPGQSGVGELQNPVEELYDLLDERGILPQLPSGPGYAGLEPHAITDMEQTPFVDTAPVGNAEQFGMEDEPMADINEGMSLDVEHLAAAAVETEGCGNVPHFNMIFDL